MSDEDHRERATLPLPSEPHEERKTLEAVDVDLIVEDLKSVTKRLSDMEVRMQNFEHRTHRPSSSAKFKVPTAHEIEMATATAELVETARELCKHLRGWCSATGTKLPHQMPMELEEAIERYDTIKQKP